MIQPTSKKIILLNAPKGSGKDTIGIAMKELYGCELRAFKSSLYQCTYPFTKFKSYDEFIHYCTDRHLKEKTTPMCRGMSPRDFLIYISEKIVKPHFGKQFFGKQAAESVSLKDLEKGVVFTDSGFSEEAIPLVEKFGNKNVYVVQFVGQGREDFNNDSRDFIDVSKAKTIKMTQKNEGILPENFAKLIAQEILHYG